MNLTESLFTFFLSNKEYAINWKQNAACAGSPHCYGFVYFEKVYPEKHTKLLDNLYIYQGEKQLYDVHHKCFVGLLQDEVKTKADRVYNKHTNSLIGFVTWAKNC